MRSKQDLQRIRGFLFDVDKTLTHSDGQVSVFTQQVLSRLEDKGYMLGVCTGRGYARLYSHILPYFSKKSLHVVSGGSQVVDVAGHERFSRSLTEDQMQLLIGAALDSQMEFLFDVGRTTYGSSWFVREKQVVPYQQYSGPSPNFVAYYVTPEFRSWIDQKPEFSLIEHESTWLDTGLCDITAQGVNKATGVQEWARLNGLALEEVAGFGDGPNDFQFLATVGLGVAMGNAVEELKQQAQVVIASADEDGLAKYLEENWLA